MARRRPIGIVVLPNGRLRAFVRQHHGPHGLKTKVFPKDTPLTDIRKWREKTKAEPAHQPVPASGFGLDAKTYLDAVKGMRSFSDRERDIKTWVRVFNDTPRSQITSAMIQTQLATWATTKQLSTGRPLSASALNHRRTALMHLWRVLDGKHAANPVHAVPKYREPEATARGVSYTIIQMILDAMPDSKTKARLQVIAYTGIPHASLGRIKSEHVSISERSVYVPGREKGKGTQGRRLPLTDAGVEAFRALIRHDAFGPFSHSSVYKTFKLARQKVDGDYVEKTDDSPGHPGCLAGLRPYDFRHSYGSALYAATGDIRATQLLMGHSKPEMTHRYTLGAVDARVALAVSAVAGRLRAEVTPKRKTKKSA